MVTIPTSQEIFNQGLTRFQSALNQTIPAFSKAFVRVLNTVETALFTTLYKYANDRLKQILALTADEEGLILIGNEYNVPIKAATQAILTVEVAAFAGAEIPITQEFTDDLNALSYYPEAAHTATGVTATFNIVSQGTGTDNNLSVSDTLTMSQAISGVSQTATVSAIDTAAISREDVEVYRQRVLTAKRFAGGGGNAYDYKRWSEELSDVRRAFPYSGKPSVDESVAAFLDGDCEAADATAYTGYGNAVVSKVSSNVAEGTKALKIINTTDDDAYFYAYQDCLVVGQGYRLRGYCKNFTSYTVDPPLIKSGTAIVWTGTTTTDETWQYFDFEFVAGDTELRFYGYTETHDVPVYFDGMVLSVSYPLDRTVYIEAVSDYEADGIADTALLNSVRTRINTDPITGRSRPSLGQSDETLWVESITRPSIYLKITGLAIGADYEATAKTQIDSDVDTYLKAITPYNGAIDAETDRNDVITKVSVSAIVQGILSNYGGTALLVEIGLATGVAAPLDSHTVKPGYLTKLGDVTYA